MLVAAAADATGRAALSRVMGVRPSDDWRAFDLMIPQVQWPKALEAVRPGAWMALTICRPSTYETYQVKGPVEDVRPAELADLAFARSYIAAVGAHLTSLGVEPAQTRPWLLDEGLVRVRLRPERLFEQTPGPAAGRLMDAPA